MSNREYNKTEADKKKKIVEKCFVRARGSNKKSFQLISTLVVKRTLTMDIQFAGAKFELLYWCSIIWTRKQTRHYKIVIFEVGKKNKKN